MDPVIKSAEFLKISQSAATRKIKKFIEEDYIVGGEEGT